MTVRANSARSIQELKRADRERLADLMQDLPSLVEDEVLAILANPYVTPQLISKIAQTARLTGFYSVRLRLVALRQTPQAHAVKLIHYLYWVDLLRLSIDVTVPAPVRRAIDTQLLVRAEKLTLGERVSAARLCSHALIKFFLHDPSPRVFAALLINKRLREDDLVALASSPQATGDQLRMLASDPKWSYRYAIRKALVLNPHTPRASAASQLRYLSRVDLRRIHSNPHTSVYLRRCIERLRPEDFSAALEGIE
ncbi:MAG TPA: hypothetical protein VF824_21740 [Thermoanaerobaculia bacterium]|jgi:hypothetical protein